MNKILKRALLPSMMAAGLVGTTFAPIQPAAANDLAEDIGIGAAAGLVTGVVTGNGGASLRNAVNGAAAGAAVNRVNKATRGRSGNRSTIQDIGVGTAASSLTGVVTNRRRPLSNAANGAAAGAAINLIRRR